MSMTTTTMAANTDESLPASSSNNPPTSDDEKSATFRKRRLSLSRHNIGCLDSDASTTGKQQGTSATASSMASAAAAAAAFDLDDDEKGDAPPLPIVTTKTIEGEDASSVASDQKAQTFRKRRLSLTLKTEDLEPVVEEDGSKTLSSPVKRSRRMSDASANSMASGDGLRVRTLHAGEIIGEHLKGTPRCPSPVPGGTPVNPNAPHVLYRLSRQPSSTSLLTPGEEKQQKQPKWKKRIERGHDVDDRKLPFPRDIVGTYSCHGVEPVYDSDYEHMEEDEEDIWTEDISGGGGSKPPPPIAAAAQPSFRGPKEPRPTTAAKINQDRGGVAFPYGNCPRTALFAAYDGHGQGGEMVSQYALHEIQSRLEKRPEFHTNLEKAFVDTFLAVDEDLQKEPLIEPLYAGTTACVALLRENELTLANTGDSRAVVARRTTQGGYQAIDLTIDQNPDLPEERDRIEAMGGFVSPPPEPGLSARVWLDEGFSQIGLAMARSIGDHAVARVGVIAEPVVSSHIVSADDEFLIIATDGVWEFLSSEAAVEIVGSNLSRGATKATQALIEAAAARWHDEEGDYRDDITALVVRLPELWKNDKTSTTTPEKSATPSKNETAGQEPAITTGDKNAEKQQNEESAPKDTATESLS